MTEGRRILLVSPAFHDYWRSVADGFEADGHTVVTHCYDVRSGLPAKLWNKVVYEGFDRVRSGSGSALFAHAATEVARSVFREVRPDVVVAVKADVLEAAFWDDVNDAGVPTVVWLYDEIRRTRHTVPSLKRFQSVASYSPLDVAALRDAGISTALVPGAFDPKQCRPPVPSKDVVFFGARYPNRERLLVELASHGVPVKVFGRDWSKHPVDRLRSWSWHRPDLPAGPGADRAETAGLMAGATAALNIHGDQDGFTMRTFEAAGAGAFEMVDRHDVGDFYEPGVEIVTFESIDEAIDLVDRASRDRSWARGIAAAGRKRTLAEHTFTHRTRELAKLWD